MKFNKKITVTALSTVLGLGLVGSISGAVAWYQYSTRATTSIIGTSVGRGGTLQIRKKVTSGTPNDWKRDLHSTDLFGDFSGDFMPVTFGGFGDEGHEALPEQAYKSPEAGKKDMKTWKEAVANEDYLQYTIEVQALQLDNTSHQYVNVAYPVYLTDIVLESIDEYDSVHYSDRNVTDALRVHISATSGSSTKNILLAADGGTLATSGKLDLDGDGEIDTVGGYEWETGYDTEITYGEYKEDLPDHAGTYILTNETQTFVGPSSLLVERGTDGKIASTNSAKSLGNTTTSGDPLTITFTIWNEGWAQLDPNDPVADIDAMWDPEKREGVEFHVGFEFDIGDVFQDEYNA